MVDPDYSWERLIKASDPGSSATRAVGCRLSSHGFLLAGINVLFFKSPTMPLQVCYWSWIARAPQMGGIGASTHPVVSTIAPRRSRQTMPTIRLPSNDPDTTNAAD